MHIEQKTNRIFRPTGNTTLSAEESNQVTTELENLITAGNLTPSAGTLTQVRDAVQNVVNVAKNDLQEQIDAITSASDVFDVVGTYAQLQAYDTSTVPVNDIIKVLQDETRNNAMTYYRWNGTSWVFIGSEGPYYTVAEVDQTFATKAQVPGIATTQQVGLVKPDGQTTIVQQDGTLSVSSNVAASLPLFTPIWADHILNNASYLRADTFSWQSGAVYISAYQHLVDDVNGITSETETLAGTTITFYRATDGHKIVLPDQESNVATIFNATGIAWYYILDTTNQRFKLPRSKWNFVGLRDSVGGYVAPGLPNITGRIYNSGRFLYAEKDGSNFDNRGALFAGDKQSGGQGCTQYGNGTGHRSININASLSNSIYGASSTVQPPATQAYLYFYVGNTVQNETSVDVGEMTEALNNKLDLDASNATADTKNAITGWCKPSNRYIDLTLGAAFTSWYQAPANGMFSLRRIASNYDGQMYGVYSSDGTTSGNSCLQYAISTENADVMILNMPVKKGQYVRIDYVSITTDTFSYFRFIYDEGAN